MREKKGYIRSSRHFWAGLGIADCGSILILLMNDTHKEPEVSIVLNNLFGQRNVKDRPVILP